MLASLNHPNIAAIYGIEDSGPTHALVMEFVAGRTLAEIIDARPRRQASRAQADPARVRTSAAASGQRVCSAMRPPDPED